MRLREERTGGQFAVGEALVDETMPVLARHYALVVAQALSAVANMIAASVEIFSDQIQQTSSIFSAWRDFKKN